MRDDANVRNAPEKLNSARFLGRFYSRLSRILLVERRVDGRSPDEVNKNARAKVCSRNRSSTKQSKATQRNARLVRSPYIFIN